MNSDIVAQRYANALFALGKEQGGAKLANYGKALASLAEMSDATPELHKFFRAPVISVAEKRAVLSRLLEPITPEKDVWHFCDLLADKQRLPLLSLIARDFGKLLDAEQGIVRGKLVTAIQLDSQRQTSILATLEQQTNQQLALRFDVDPGILGGIVLQLGDKVLDVSLRAQLNSLRDIIKRGE